MVGLRKRKSPGIDGEQQNIREIVIVKKRKQLDEEKRAIVQKNKEVKESKGNERAIVKNGNAIDVEDIAIVKNRNEIDEEDVQNGKERTITEKRKQLYEERAILKDRNEVDEEVVAILSKKIDEKEEQKGKEKATVKKRNHLDEERSIVKKEQNGIVGEEIICKSLPGELWTENILARLPAGTLARCSSVSKLWYNSTYKDTRFAKIHNVQNNIRQL